MRLRLAIAGFFAAAIAVVVPLGVHWNLGGAVTSSSGVSLGTSVAPGAPLTVGGVLGTTTSVTPASLSDSKAPGAILTQSGMKPGDSASSHVTITANASVSVTVFENTVTHTGAVGTGNLADDLQLVITDQTASKTLYTGPFDGLPASTSICSIHSTGTQCLAWSTAEAHTFLFSVTFPLNGGHSVPHLPTRAPAIANPDDLFDQTGASATIVWGAAGLSTSCSGAIRSGNNIEVPKGVTCVLVDYSLSGNALVDAGGILEIHGGTFGGNIQSTGGTLSIGAGLATTVASIAGNVQAQGGSINVSQASIKGNLQIQQTGAKGHTQSICSSTIGGNVQVQSNLGTVVIGDSSQCSMGNQVGGNLQVLSNSGPPPAPAAVVSANSVHGNLQCTGNSPAATGVAKSNSVHGQVQGDCVPLGAKV